MIVPAALECSDLDVAYGDVPVLRGLDLVVGAGETVALLGPSGSGKTSLLYAVAGFVTPSGGRISVGGRVVSGGGRTVPPERRDLGFVFQHYALWPHLDALDTVAYPLRRAGSTAGDARRRATELLALMGVAHLAARRPAQLSGGEQQRVGVARALARSATLLLLDEPTAHLDVPLRAALVAELAEQRRRTGAAAVYATHDVGEALAIADRVMLLRDGAVIQVGDPLEIYERPVDAWVARLSGAASVLHGELVATTGDPAQVRIGRDVMPVELTAAEPRVPGPVRLLVRADWAELDAGAAPVAIVSAAWFRGPHTDYRLVTDAGELELRAPGPPRALVGECVGWRLRRAWVLPGDDR